MVGLTKVAAADPLVGPLESAAACSEGVSLESLMAFSGAGEIRSRSGVFPFRVSIIRDRTHRRQHQESTRCLYNPLIIKQLSQISR